MTNDLPIGIRQYLSARLHSDQKYRILIAVLAISQLSACNNGPNTQQSGVVEDANRSEMAENESDTGSTPTNSDGVTDEQIKSVCNRNDVQQSLTRLFRQEFTKTYIQKAGWGATKNVVDALAIADVLFFDVEANRSIHAYEYRGILSDPDSGLVNSIACEASVKFEGPNKTIQDEVIMDDLRFYVDFVGEGTKDLDSPKYSLTLDLDAAYGTMVANGISVAELQAAKAASQSNINAEDVQSDTEAAMTAAPD
tara:strand:+ start:1130 stop:1888 length:759 start_codon:yes stop_codon:yes gene_type:complete